MKMTIGEKITELRKKNNYTQDKLSDKIGISRQTLSNWEGDITSPDLRQASILAQIFNISLDELVNNNVELLCKNNSNNILMALVGKDCYLDIEEEDYRLNFNTVCRALEVDNSFIKIQFTHSRKTITKLVDINLISSFKIVSKKEEL